jgi:hypothetical protein
MVRGNDKILYKVVVPGEPLLDCGSLLLAAPKIKLTVSAQALVRLTQEKGIVQICPLYKYQIPVMVVHG